MPYPSPDTYPSPVTYPGLTQTQEPMGQPSQGGYAQKRPVYTHVNGKKVVRWV